MTLEHDFVNILNKTMVKGILMITFIYYGLLINTLLVVREDYRFINYSLNLIQKTKIINEVLFYIHPFILFRLDASPASQ